MCLNIYVYMHPHRKEVTIHTNMSTHIHVIHGNNENAVLSMCTNDIYIYVYIHLHMCVCGCRHRHEDEYRSYVIKRNFQINTRIHHTA